MKTTQNRRDFLKISGAGALGIMALGPTACNMSKSVGVGLQLYSIRDAMDADVPGTLKKVADLDIRIWNWPVILLVSFMVTHLPSLSRWSMTWVCRSSVVIPWLKLQE